MINDHSLPYSKKPIKQRIILNLDNTSMKLQLPKPLLCLPPILIPLSAYIASTALFWGIFHNAIPALYGILYLYIFSLFLAFTYKKVNPYILAFIIGSALLGLARNHQTVSYYQAFPFNITEKSVTIRGTFSYYSYNPTSRFPYCNTIAIHSLCSNKTEIQASYIIQMYTRKKLLAEVDDEIEVKDIILKRPKDDSFYIYLMKEGIAATLFKEEQPITIRSHRTISFSRWLFHTKNNIVRAFKKHLNTQTFGLFTAIFLGEKTALKHAKDSLESLFKQWGIVHYLARSGLHLVIIISLCKFLLRCIPMGFIYKQLFLLSAVLLYSFLSWTSISFMRALLTFLMYSFCLISRTPHHLMQLLLLCCFIFLLINPLYILFLDFQLSFGLTFALAWLNLFRTAPPAAD